jgi:transposase
MFARGESQAAVAEALGVSSAAANHWHQAWTAEGRQGLKAAGRAGRKPQLGPEQLAAVERALRGGPAAHGFSTDLWTLPRVAIVIKRVTGVEHHPGHVWRILRKLGWSLQRPARRARERDEAAIAQWKSERWPRLKKRPAAAGLARLRRRKRRLAAAGRPPHVGPSRRNPDPEAHRSELEAPVCCRRARIPMERSRDPLLLSDAGRNVLRRAAHYLPARPQTAFPRRAAHSDLGWPRRP